MFTDKERLEHVLEWDVWGNTPYCGQCERFTPTSDGYGSCSKDGLEVHGSEQYPECWK